MGYAHAKSALDGWDIRDVEDILESQGRPHHDEAGLAEWRDIEKPGWAGA
jgi:hypothetical protein